MTRGLSLLSLLPCAHALRAGALSMSSAATAVTPLASIESSPMFLDEQEALAAAAFPLSESVLIEKTKTYDRTCPLSHSEAAPHPGHVL